MTKKKKPLLSGAFGAVVGGFLLSIIMTKGKLLGPYFLIFILRVFVPYMLPLLIITGAIIGGVVWWFHVRTDRNLGVLVRAIIGAILAAILGVIISFIIAGFSKDDLQQAIDKNTFQPLLIAVYGLLVGAIAGIMVGDQTESE